MENLRVDRKHPDAAIPQLEKAINELLPVGLIVKSRGAAPGIGRWKLVGTSGDAREYERVQ